MWQQLRRLITGRTRAQQAGREADTQHDPAQPDDAASFVGRASGDDAGYTGETGAERRTERDR
jgi:hypothetical protein